MNIDTYIQMPGVWQWLLILYVQITALFVVANRVGIPTGRMKGKTARQLAGALLFVLLGVVMAYTIEKIQSATYLTVMTAIILLVNIRLFWIFGRGGRIVVLSVPVSLGIYAVIYAVMRTIESSVLQGLVSAIIPALIIAQELHTYHYDFLSAHILGHKPK